jgi:hypothetical protein
MVTYGHTTQTLFVLSIRRDPDSRMAVLSLIRIGRLHDECMLGRLSPFHLFIHAPWSRTTHDDQGFLLKQAKVQIDTS